MDRFASAVTPVRALTVLSTGLLAGAFGYGAVNVAQTFKAVPLDVRLTFHVELMKMNAVVMQVLMVLAAVSPIVLAVLTRGTQRLLAAGAGVLVVTSYLVTMFGNVPINGQIREWVAGTIAADHAAILERWETFHAVRTSTALLAFLTIITLVTVVLEPARRAVAAPAAAAA
ncbi:DUF1772 domain-containing protein [Pseudonocardia sp. TRM90224]|uniref:DUF1772 domain-containing protein n=1 Tax=Pseudonocardia sp. TRM90224 TaxID=2812678 RepID=UPI001E39F4D4|nr:DUF1772 domain-containing protein [Pseudonocardia sp. TRM90224]